MLVRSFTTPEYHGFNLKFCPFKSNRLACVASRNFGISGEGSLFVIDDVLEPAIPELLTSYFHWKDCLFDVAWSEFSSDVIVTASGDGSLQTWSLQSAQTPTGVLIGHEKEIASVDWSQTRISNHLVSGSWDKTTKTWDCEAGKCVETFFGHEEKVYCVVWSPLIPHCFASAAGDGSLCLWNSEKPGLPILKVHTNSGEVLSCSWSYYDKDILVTTGTDNTIKGWDLRKLHCPVFQLVGHKYAVKKVKFSPHMRCILSTVSYDFTTRIWDFNCERDVHCFQHHSEFVSGLDFSSHITGLMADCGWDQKIQVFSWPCLAQNVLKDHHHKCT